MHSRDPGFARPLAVLVISLFTLSCGGDSGPSGPTPNPTPTITASARDTATAGTTPFSVVLGGTDFMVGAVASFDGNARATNRLSSGAIAFALQTSDLAVTGDHEIRAKNPEPGGGPSTPFIFHVLVPPPVPVLDSLSPDTIVANSVGTLDLKAFGHGFVPGAVLRMNGGTVTTVRMSDTLLQTTIVGGILGTPGSVTMTVFKQGPGGGTSAGKAFTIVPQPPPPAITALSPDTMRTGEAPATLHIYGHGFAPATVINFNTVNLTSTPPITFVADTEVTLQVPLAQLTTKKFAMVSLQGANTYKVLQLLPPLLVVASISPDSAGLGDSIVFTARGTGFVPPGDDYSNTLVRWRGVLQGTDFLTDSTLRVKIPIEQGQAGGVVSVAFVNQGDKDTAYATFTITRPVPVITALNPGTDTTGPDPRTLFGRARGIDSTVQVYVNGILHPSAGLAPYPWDSVGYFSAQLSAGEAATPGPLQITLVNLGPGGGTSAPDTFWLVKPNPVPVIDSVVPRVTAIGGTGVTLALRGHEFLPGVTAFVSAVSYSAGAELPASFIDSTEITIALPDSLFTDAAVLSIHARNPAPTADWSNTGTATVRSSEIASIGHMDLNVGVLLGDSLRGVVYASVPAYDPGGPKLLVIDPALGSVLTELPIDGEVGDLAMSSDGAWLYAAIPSSKSLRRFDLVSRTLDQSWNSLRSESGALLAPVAIASSPTTPTTLAVLTVADFGVDGLNRMVIFDDTVPRAHVAKYLTWWGSDLAFPTDSEVVELQLTAASPWHIVHVDSLGTDSIRTVTTSITAASMIIRGDTILTDDGSVSLWRDGTLLGHVVGRSFALGSNGTVYSILDRGGSYPIHELHATSLANLTELGGPLATTGLVVGSAHHFVRWGPGKFALGGYPGLDVVQVVSPGW